MKGIRVKGEGCAWGVGVEEEGPASIPGARLGRVASGPKGDERGYR